MISNSNASAAMVLHAFLLDEGFGTDPSVDLETAWPVFYSFLPDEGVRDDAICIYDLSLIHI